MKKKNLWKLSVVMSTFVMLSSVADSAEVLSGNVLNNTGMGGANLNKVTGARVDTDLTNASITNTMKNSVLEWNTLNTGSNQSLNYIFPNAIGAGQTSLNKVNGVGMSQFAGKLTTEGAGHVIISNPNGMIMHNGAMVNANELTLTTKSVLLDEFGNMTIRDNGLKNPITIGNGGSTVIRVAKNLNIVAPIINVNGADIAVVDSNDKSVLGGDIRLITSDGVNFFVDTNTFKANQGIIHGQKNLSISNSKIAVKNKETGKIYLTSKGNLDITNSDISNAKAEVLGYANVKNGTKTVDSTVYGAKGVTVENSRISGSSLATENNIKILNNSTIDSTRFYAQKGNVDATNAVIQNGSAIKAGVLNLDNSRFENSTAETSYIANVINNTTLTNSKINAEHNVKISNAKATNSDIQSKQKINVDTNSVINSTRLFANGEITVNNAKIENDSQLSTDKDLLITNAILEGSGNLRLYSKNLTRLTDTTARGLYLTGNSIAFYSSRISNSNFDIKDTLTITKNSELSSVFGINYGQMNINGNSRVANNSTLASTAGINLGEATIANSKLISEQPVFAQKTTLDSATVSSTKGDIYLSDLTVMNNSNILAKKNLKIDRSYLLNANINGDTVKLVKSKLNNSKVKAESDILISGGRNDNSNILSYGTLGLVAAETFNSDISSVGEMTIYGTNTLENSKLFTNGKMTAEDLYVNNSSVLAQDTAVIKKSNFENSKVYAKNYLTLKSNIVNNSNLSSVDIEIGNSDVKNTKLDAKRHVSFYKNSNAENIYADYLQSISVTTDSTIKNSHLKVGYLLLDGVEADNVNANAKYDLKYKNTTFLGNSVTAYAKQNIILNNVVNSANINLEGGNLYISNSVLGDAVLAATMDEVNIVSSEANSLSVRGNGDVVLYDSSVNNNLNISNNNSNVALVGNYVGGNTTIDNSKNVIIKSADSDNHSTMFDDLTEGKTSVTSYNTRKYTDEDFTSKMSDGNKNSIYMGSLNINNAENISIVDTVLLGDTNINYVSNGAEIINTYVGGNVANNNLSGDYSWFRVYDKSKQENGNKGNNGNHYGWDNGNWDNGNHYGWNNGNHKGWGHKDNDHNNRPNPDNIGWDNPRDDYFNQDHLQWDNWGWGRPHDNFLAYWNNFMYGFFLR